MAKKTHIKVVEDLIAEISALHQEKQTEETSRAIVHLNEVLHWLTQYQQIHG